MKVLINSNKVIPGGLGRGPITEPTEITKNLYKNLLLLGYDVTVVESDDDKEPVNQKKDTKTYEIRNIAVSVDLWSEDDKYSQEGFPYSAKIPFNGITVSDSLSIIFDLKEATSGNFASVVINDEPNCFKIFAKEIPTEDFIIPCARVYNTIYD